MQSLLTPRVRLVPLAQTELAVLLASDRISRRIAGAALDPQLIDPAVERAIRMKLEKMRHAPIEEHPWLTYWLVVLRSEDRGIGLLGFKGLPNEGGDVEIGYGIAPEYRCRGLTTEAASCLIEWALSDPRCLGVTAVGVRSGNEASERVLAKLGMRLVRRDESRTDWRVDADGFSDRAG
jgi:ribosomal-protein-alanine N-acetyltransferase